MAIDPAQQAMAQRMQQQRAQNPQPQTMPRGGEQAPAPQGQVDPRVVIEEVKAILLAAVEKLGGV